MTHPTEWPPAFTRTTLPAVEQVNGVYPVLEGVRQGRDNLMGGFGYLEWSPIGQAFHEGIDLNSRGGGDADLGALVVAPLGGVVTFAEWWDGRRSGFGSHLALWMDDPRAAAPCYLHVAHLNTLAAGDGQRVVAGQALGTCGKTGNQPYAHVHTALWHEVPPGGWSFWQTGKSREWVRAHTVDPQNWYWASVAKAGQAPEEAVVSILSGAQTTAVQAVIWGDYWRAGASAFAIEASWRDEWRRGVWRGAPLSDEQLIPEDAAEGKPGGSWRLFEHGAAVWLPGEECSWNG